ncbi:hypothetical protein Misp01_08470 [Microtetraspora sp. NBRC 13810]|uniref:hypothetical protein n=1 Tax=Microtetraspora sp. NBRC 13810 TaxID=3030990 RepID=UPI0024A3E51A|nr:hypothetical protein [Microtetraspora sp. NBRC 13810]GLW05717.1 hypothetical protein Misp01_08470 [Microtetraspora sp. NBRC 13810]
MDGARTLRVSLRAAAGQLVGRCWCGRTHAGDDPVEMWDWLDEHEHEEPACRSAAR